MPTKGKPLIPLTASEVIVRDHMSNYWRTKEIARVTGWSCSWIEQLRASIFSKYGIDPQLHDGQSMLVGMLLREATERSVENTLARTMDGAIAEV